MSQLSEKEQEEIVMVLNVVKPYPHISAKDKRTILNTLLSRRTGRHRTEVGDMFTQYNNNQKSLRATIIKIQSDRLEIAVQSQYRDFWVGFLNTLGADVEKKDDITIKSDSKLVVEQVNGNWKVKDPKLIPLCRDARVLIDMRKELFDVSTELYWLPREENLAGYMLE